MTDISEFGQWPVGGGEAGRLVRAFDWAKTPLGPMSSWPANLRHKVNSVVNSPIPQVLMWGPDHVMIYNDGYIEIAGNYHPKALGGTVPDIWPEIWDWNKAILEAGFRGEVQSFRDQTLVLNRLGRPEDVIFDLFYTPIHNDAGTVDGVLCTVLENTDKVKAVAELAASREELSRLTNALPILVGFIDHDHIYRFANQGYLEWFNHRPEEVLGRRVSDVVGDVFYQKRRPYIERALDGETVINDAEIPCADGITRAAEIRYVPRRSSKGDIDGCYVLIIDIETRKRVERELLVSNNRFRAAVSAVHGVLWTNSPDGKMIGEQHGWAELTGQTFDQYQAYGWADAVHRDDREGSIDSWNRAVATKSTYVWEHRVRRHDGVFRTFAIRAIPILDVAGTIIEWVGVHTDITEQRSAEATLKEHSANLEREIRHRIRAEEQLRHLNEGLETRVAAEISERRHAERALQQAQKMESIGQLTGGVAHDFNNLLQVVAGNLQLLAKDVAGNERAERRVGNALAGVSRGAKLASQLLAFGRRQALEPRVINVGKFVVGMDDLLRRSLGEAVEVEVITVGGLWNTYADPTQVENALLNLAINARDAMEGSGKLTIEVGNAALDQDYARTHAEVEAGQYVMLAVSDTGSGMSPAIMDKVFEPFFSTKPEGKGTGLGLSMVYGFVKQSGGHVKIYSEIGQGTTVKIYLPRSHSDEDREVVIQNGPIVGGTETILVVEDDDEVRSTVVETLSDLGYRVLTARDAQAGLTVAESGIPIDVIFTDVVMPGPLKSSEMARRAKERLPHLAILFTSGYTENSIVHGGKLDAGVELLSKPYTREALARRLRHVIANQKQRAEASRDRTSEQATLAKLRSKTSMRVMLVEDDDLIRMNTTDILLEGGHLVIEAANAMQAMDLVQREEFDVLVTDVGLPDMSGSDLALFIKTHKPEIGIVFATGDNFLPKNAPAGSVLLCKPYDENDVRFAITQALSADV
ncbi:PAS domain-containing protein [Agrobacterium rubi]|uniref:histidine kinase n=2 Tax=Agrobacterium rubi TaxID=28099 RepID=A0AAE7RBG1_9HYPH|nr:PAS domain-containing protein [Agrobacterium rubi]MBP1878799.1 PAS domain S-box-containing protein [Agrobacterium rubi]MCL6652842.1 hybrid sensor histidine kinase/response regulator [Agrobacterium rubi]NTE88580.1 PAS domain-containing protein [Agrobacterium rubi]NTF04408.1 PAS domain-containing protein [Agrobacterium rubi]NTF09941.1 PAS domain-containing protein [Agrobacterium rubi]